MKQNDPNTYMKAVQITGNIEHITFFWWVGGERSEESGTAKTGTAQKLAKENNWILI